jgi:hypothetical protein
VLERVGEYVLEYEDAFSNLVAEETCTQKVELQFQKTYYTTAPSNDRAGQRPTAVQYTEKKVEQRVTRADLVFVRLTGVIPWASYRDVFEVDGRKVRDHEERLLEFFTKAHVDAHQRAQELLLASARYNIGPLVRTTNLPTLPLVFLLQPNQGRFRFELGGRHTVANTEVVELRFTEVMRPTLVKGPEGVDLPTAGYFLVNPRRGTVVRSVVRFDFGPEHEGRVTTVYESKQALAMWVPVEMKERYADMPNAKVRLFHPPFESEARYGNFRKFSVSTEEKVASPKADDR